MVLKKSVIASALVLVAGFASMGSAQAQNVYVGTAYTQYNFEGSGSITPTAATFKLGYVVNSNFAVEGRFASSMSSESVKVDSHSGIYAKGILPLNDNFSVYGLLGTNSLTLKSQFSSASKSSSSYGLGVDFALTKEVSLNAEWTRLFADVTSTSFGVAYKF
ncbi:MAG: porin family protein [Rhodoferax sp.]|nr:porin family protein [Rhodoferax sp.]